MSDPLYSLDVLRLAADATGAGRLDEPRLSHTEHNPTCGDRVTVDLHVEGGRVVAMAHETKACVLSQASASALAGALPGLDHRELAALRDAVVAMLSKQEPFEPFRALQSVAAFPSRHRCVLLPIDAALRALEAGEPRRQGA